MIWMKRLFAKVSQYSLSFHHHFLLWIQDFSAISCMQASPKEEENLFDLALGITKANGNQKPLPSLENEDLNVHEKLAEQFFSSEIDDSNYVSPSFFQMLISGFNSNLASFQKPQTKQIASQKPQKAIKPVDSKSSSNCSVKCSQKRPKAELTVAVVGHVDCGKSTLIGQLLVQSGAVLQSTVEN